MIKAFSLDAQENLQPFSQYLRGLRVPHRISEQAGHQILWVGNKADAESVRSAYQLYKVGALPQLQGEGFDAASARPEGLSWQQFMARLAEVPCVATLILLSLLVTALLNTPVELQVFTWLRMGTFDYLRESGEYWRLITPIFLHFGVMHLAFNMVLLWFFGRQLETQETRRTVLFLLVVFAVIPNVAQYIMAGSRFGGMSGLVYAVLGYCWLMDRLNPHSGYVFPKALMGLMVAWLLIGFSDLLSYVGFPHMANAAHLGGLLSGLLCAWAIHWTRNIKRV